MTRHFRFNLTLGLIVPTAASLWMGVQCYRQTARLIAISVEVEQARGRIDRLVEIGSLLKESESSDRDVLSMDDGSRQTSKVSRDRLKAAVVAFSEWGGDEWLGPFSAAIDKSSALRAADDHRAARVINQQILATLANRDRAERDALTTLNREAERSAAGSLGWLSARMVMTLLMGIGLYLIVTAEIRRRRRVESVLRESEERFRRGFATAAIGMALVALDGRMLRVNHSLCECLGYSEEELLARDLQSITHPDDLAVDVSQLARVSSGEIDTYRMEKRYIHKSGHEVFTLQDVSVVRDEAGRAIHVFSQVQDMTARVIAERRIQNDHRFMESVANSLPLTLYLFDLTHQRTIWANARHARIFDLTAESRAAMTGTEVEELIHPDDLPAFADHQARLGAAADGEVCEVEYRTRDRHDEWRWYRSRDVVFRRDADGRPIEVVGTGEDVTERRLARAELAMARGQLADTIESLDSGLVMYDANDRLVVCNRKIREMYPTVAALMTPGATFQKILRSSMREQLDAGDERIEATIAKQIEGHRRYRGVFEHRVGKRWVRVEATPMLDGGVVRLHTDVTEKKRAEDDLRQARDSARAAERVKADFLANVSHEIRTPMNGVMGMAELLLGTALSADQREFVSTIRSSAEGLLTVINDVLDFSKIEAGKLELDRTPFVLRAFIDRTLRSIATPATAKGLELRVEVEPETPEILLGDPHRLQQVLINLVGNAIKFAERGEIVVSVSRGAEEPSSDASVTLSFAVTDTGIGVPESRRSAIFEPFEQADGSTTRKFGGTGLGLAICSKLVALMGGSIGVEGRPEGGSIFRFTATFGRPPRTADASVEIVDDDTTGPASVAAARPERRLRILLAEDVVVNQKVALRMLERLGHLATAVSNGQEALAALDSGLFDLVLMDVSMPEMDGFEALAEIRRRESEPSSTRTPVVALTAHAMSGDRERCLSAGFDAYLSKPIRIANLSAALDELTPAPALAVAMVPDLATFRAESLATSCGDDPEIIADVLGSFLTEAPADFARLVGALESHDRCALNRATHCLKGTCLTVGAEALAETCRQLETLDDPPEAIFLNRLNREWTELVDAIEAHRREMGMAGLAWTR